ncbi:MAG TPA: hypothetical protein VLG27_01360 [Candidatus Saccharimonadia bacterium]|nr:hypothetical protein [Candidatus Saccharimonadia bacterium]
MSITETFPAEPQAGKSHEGLPDPVVLDAYNRILSTYNQAGIFNAEWRSARQTDGTAIFNTVEMIDGKDQRVLPVESVLIQSPDYTNTISSLIKIREITESGLKVTEHKLTLARNLPLDHQKKVVSTQGKAVAETTLTLELIKDLAFQIEAPTKAPVSLKPETKPPQRPSIWQRLSALALRYAHKS